MRSKSTSQRLRALIISALAVGFSAPAIAGAGHQDRVYADSFGNLVIDSAAGYKRIIVGEGKLAKELSAFTSAGQPKVLYEHESDDVISGNDCYRPPAFVKGRAYMYGLSDGEMPDLTPCR